MSDKTQLDANKAYDRAELIYVLVLQLNRQIRKGIGEPEEVTYDSREGILWRYLGTAENAIYEAKQMLEG